MTVEEAGLDSLVRDRATRRLKKRRGLYACVAG